MVELKCAKKVHYAWLVLLYIGLLLWMCLKKISNTIVRHFDFVAIRHCPLYPRAVPDIVAEIGYLPTRRHYLNSIFAVGKSRIEYLLRRTISRSSRMSSPSSHDRLENKLMQIGR
jgi:hypothetical protein